MRTLHPTLLTASLVLLATVQLPLPVPGQEPARPRTALVLGGGGARGAAHAGVLEELEALGIRFDLVVGTSMGAVIGGLYASGLSPAELREWLEGEDWREHFTDLPPRRNLSFRRKQDDNRALFRFEMGIRGTRILMPSGLIAGQKFGFLLRTSTLHAMGIENFDDLAIPFRAIATDLFDGEMVVLGHGDLATAIRASMSVPGVYSPVNLDGRTLVDGGIARNLPVDVARSLGAERIVAVDASRPLDTEDRALSAIRVARMAVDALTDVSVREQRALLGEGDVLIRPSMEDIGVADFDRVRDAMAAGRLAVREQAARLAGFAVAPNEFRAFAEGRRPESREPGGGPIIRSVEVSGTSRVDPRLITRRIRSSPGDRLDPEVLRSDLERIYRIGDFQHIDFRLEQVPGGTDLHIETREKDWGPNIVRLGVALEANFDGAGDFTILGDLRRTQINRLGAEWKTVVTVGETNSAFTELFQPLEYRGLWFVAPRVGYRRSRIERFDDGGPPELTRERVLEGGIDVGLQMSNWGELRMGLRRATLSSDFDTTPETHEFQRLDLGGARVSLIVDHLDNAGFPRRGAFASTELWFSRRSLGADEAYERASVILSGAGSRGRHTFLGQIRYGTSFDSDLPFHDRFELGGFLRLSGLRPGELRGDALAYGRLAYYFRAGQLPGALGGGVYLGGAIEAGNVWEDRRNVDVDDLRPAGVVFGGVDTILGPLYLGYGRTDSGDDSFYLFLGRPL